MVGKKRFALIPLKLANGNIYHDNCFYKFKIHENHVFKYISRQVKLSTWIGNKPPFKIYTTDVSSVRPSVLANR